MTTEKDNIQEPLETSMEKESAAQGIFHEGNPQETETVPTQEGSPKDNFEKIKQFTEEDDNKIPSSISLRSILGGDFLTARLMHRQMPMILAISGLFIFYINSRYRNQAELIEIDNLKKELDDARFNALTTSSELTAKSRQSYVENFLRSSKDSLLQISSNPPYVIKLNSDLEIPTVSDEMAINGLEKKDSISDD